MPRLSREAIVAQLGHHGLRFRSVTVSTEGDYLVSDVDWNNKDVPHLNHVHAWANDVTCVMEEDLQATVSLQQVLGIPFPVVIVHYDSAPDHQTHFFTILAWTIVTDIEFVRVGPMRTRTVTTYSVGGNRFWMLFFPLIRTLLRRNYRQLMSEDVPLRERRGRLRRWGYTFRGDDRPTRDIRASLAIHADNLVAPDDLAAPAPADLAVADVPTDGWALLFRDDHLGLKLTRRDGRLLAFARTCPHEGADLDGVTADDRCQVCPWHGRRLAPLATLDPTEDGAEATTDWHRLRIDGDRVVVEVTDPTAPPRGAAP